MYNPQDLEFMIRDDEGEVSVFIMEKGRTHTEELRETDISGLPSYFEVSDAENFWTMPEDKTYDEVKSDMIAAGFAYTDDKF